MLSIKLALRLARHWMDAWQATRRPESSFDDAWYRIESRYARALQIRQRLDFALERHLAASTQRLSTDLRFHLGELARLAG